MYIIGVLVQLSSDVHYQFYVNGGYISYPMSIIVQSIYVKNRVNLPLIATYFFTSPVVSENILE